MFKLNKNIEVKTPDGFKSFSGIQKVYKPFYHWIIFDDRSEIKCSDNHSFGKEKIKASTIKVNDLLQGKKVVYNEIVEEGIYLYDLLDVGEDNLYYSNNLVSHNCEFLGSINTLINPSKLRNLVYQEPIRKNAGLDIHTNPEKDHNYLMTVDVARGMGNDYSAFIVFDITEFPYKVVAKYRNNEIKPMLFPNIIEEVAKGYNSAWMLIEINDIGDQVANILHFDLEYPNILMASMRGRNGQIVGQGFSGKRSQLGVRTTSGVKKLGCSNLKTLLEDDKILVSDYEVISELTTFSQRGNTFEAEEGCNDDLAMCLVLFSWLVAQEYFKEMTNNDVRKRLYEEKRNEIEQDMAPFGFVEDGLNDTIFTDTDGDTWHVDEYGDRSYMWDYM